MQRRVNGARQLVTRFGVYSKYNEIFDSFLKIAGRTQIQTNKRQFFKHSYFRTHMWNLYRQGIEPPPS